MERQKNQRLEQENEQLRAKLEQVSQLHQPQAFAGVPSALPVLAPQMQQQKALDAIIKASQQQALQQIALQQLLQHQQSQPSALAGANLQVRFSKMGRGKDSRGWAALTFLSLSLSLSAWFVCAFICGSVSDIWAPFAAAPAEPALAAGSGKDGGAHCASSAANAAAASRGGDDV